MPPPFFIAVSGKPFHRVSGRKIRADVEVKRLTAFLAAERNLAI